ncbi:MAG TPA: M36 family metallopeptidase [Xanthomonadales bacterium]|nr:M36 family metallopeptidase [Xanthomonadales bacterium]
MTSARRTLQRSLLACLVGAALSSPVSAFTELDSKAERTFDARDLIAASPQRAAIGAQAAAIAALRSRVPELAVQIDALSGATRSLTNPVGYLTGPSPVGDVKAVALNFVRDNASLLGLTAADVAEYEITDDVLSRASGVRHLYLRQMHQGLPVYNGQLQVHIDRDGSILGLNNQFLPNLAQSVNRQQPSLTALQAVVAAATHLNRIVGPISQGASDASPRQRSVLNASALSVRPIEASLMLLPIGAGEARLVWNFQTWLPGGGDIADFTVDAETGKIWTRISWVADADYKVYPLAVESPQHTAPLPPADGRVTLTNPQTPASPFGWHDTNGVAGPEFTTTQGNNVHAYTDTDANDTPDAGSSPDCSAALNCVTPLDLTLAPSSYRPAAVTNLFYFNNVMHDIAYPFGFDEEGGNFQASNYGNPGLGNDSVQAEAQDGEGTNNANFGTPPDGQRPRMQMFVWTGVTPNRDGDFDNGIIAHEYGHGISNRLVGGPSNTSCLANTQRPGEGLSDWWAMYYTQPNDTSSAARLRGIGTYALGQPVSGQGIRQDYYDGDPAVNPEPFENTWTYQSIIGATPPHGTGSRWAQAYWQVSWALIDKHGYNPDIDAFTGTAADDGNIRAMYYIIEGLKNTACGPAFTDVRDGIIQAAAAAQPYNGADVCLIWEAFAEFGLGSNAISGGANANNPTNGFNIPNACSFLGATAPTQKICAGGNAVFPVTLGAAFTPPVTLTVTGHPAGTTATFATTPVATVPAASSLTIGNTGAVAAGSYNLTVNAAFAPGPAATMPLTLQVASGVPSVPALSAPANAAVDVSVSPVLNWTAATQADEYVVEIATDAAFANIVYTRTVAGNSHTVQTSLQGSTLYHWRVRSTNACGPSSNAPAQTFTTQDFYCVSPNLAIPDNNATGVSSDLIITNGGNVTDLNLSLNVTHTYLGDVQFKLRNVSTGTEVTVFNRSCAGGDNINALFDDEAPIAITCSASAPVLNGTMRPANPLTAFDGQARNTTWRLTAIDLAGQDLGTVNQWCLSGTAGVAANVFANGFE